MSLGEGVVLYQASLPRTQAFCFGCSTYGTPTTIRVYVTRDLMV